MPLFNVSNYGNLYLNTSDFDLVIYLFFIYIFLALFDYFLVNVITTLQIFVFQLAQGVLN